MDRISDEEINSVILSRNCEWVSGEYRKSADKIEIKFPCGHVQFALFSNFRKGHGCRICGRIQGNKTRTNPPEEIINKIESFGFTFLEFPEGYVGCHSHVLYSCCFGHVTKRTVIDFSYHPTCNICRMNKMSEDRRFSHDEICDILNAKDCILISDDDYINRDSKLSILFSCGHEELICMQTFLNRSDPVCRKCLRIFKKGSEHWSWTGMTPTLMYLRRCIKEWYLKSLQETNFKCLITGEPAQTVHHVLSFNWIARSLFYNLNFELKESVSEYTEQELAFITTEFIKLHNSYGLGAPLTKKIHNLFHKTYGLKNFTPENFYEFRQLILTGEVQI